MPWSTLSRATRLLGEPRYAGREEVIDLNEGDGGDDDEDDARYVRTLDDGGYLYCRSFDKLSRRAMMDRADKSFFWFALEPAYGSDDTYGPVVTTWRIRGELRLLDLSTLSHRSAISSRFGLPPDALDPDEQYSGGGANLRAHTLLLPALDELRLHGTYISDADADEACAGPSEVVLSSASLRLLRKM